MHVLLRNTSLLLVSLLAFVGACSDSDNDDNNNGNNGTQTGFITSNLLSDQAGVATHTSPEVVNSWGIAMDSQSFWIANNGTGFISVVAPDGSPSKFAPASSALDTGAAITGIVANPTGAFVIGPNGNRAAAQMLVASEDGKIFAINPNVASTPQLVIDRSSAGANYKGLAVYTASDGSARLAATDFHNGRIDVWDGSFAPLATVTFIDPTITRGLAPFNIVAIGRNLYVTFAVQDADRKDDVPGAGNGRIDVFDIDGRFVSTMLDGGLLNAPWGIAVASSDFSGSLNNQLIVGNFGDGTMLAINPSTGTSAQLLTPSGSPVIIDGLWGLAFGNGANVGSTSSLYFTAGPQAETHGLYGNLILTTQPVP